MLEAIENNWDDILQAALQYPVDSFARDSSHTYESGLGAGIWGAQSRGNNPFAVLGSIGTIPPFEAYSSNSTTSSPMLSDDYICSPEDGTKPSVLALLSEGTISPKDSLFRSPDVSETMGPGLRSPISPVKASHPVDRPPRGNHNLREPEVPQAGPLRRRSTKLSSATTPRGRKSASPVSNNNSSRPMTARDRKRRQMHNASAMRSRIRLNETLDKMWKTIPLFRRRRLASANFEGREIHNDLQEDLDEDEGERIGRADKVEVGIEYIMYLEDRVKALEEQLNDARG